MVEILKEPVFAVLLIRPHEFELIPRECHRVKRECHHISSNSKMFPLWAGSKKWFWKPMPSRLPYRLDKHVDGRPKYISCWVEFLNSSKENLFLDYKCILAIYKKGILITDTLSKSGDPQSGSSASPAYPTSVQKYAHSVLKHSGVVGIDDVVHSFLEKPIR